MQKSFVLTSSESKRLIAKGIAECELVKNALRKGLVAVAKGTTNSYVAEELSGEPIDKTLYCTGTTKPVKKKSDVNTANELSDLVYRDGQLWEGISAADAVAKMKAADVFIKGANALNYDRDQAGILVGHPTGGTIGAAIGTLVARRAVLLIPVSIEKSIPGDLYDTAKMIECASDGSGPTLWPVSGEIFTEIEALKVLCDVQAWPIAAGGILGAEGSVRMSAWGTEEQIENVNTLLAQVHGEPPFGYDS